MSSFNKSYNQFKSYNTEKTVVKTDFEIKVNDFPELSSPVKNDSNNVKSFSSLLKKEEIINVEEIIEDVVPPGWVLYKYSKNNKGLFPINYSKLTTKIETLFINKNIDIVKQKEVSESEKIIKALLILHEKRTNEYKESWGEDEWEQNFICPNHDYEYFNKLDEAYEIEQNNKLNEEYEQYYNDNYDY